MPVEWLNNLGWVGLALLSLIFLANALGVVTQAEAVRDLVSSGLSESTARRAVLAGRFFQLAAAPALFFAPLRPFAALGLGAFLLAATLSGHAFWKKPREQREAALIGFLKNAAILGGLFLAAGWRMSA